MKKPLGETPPPLAASTDDAASLFRELARRERELQALHAIQNAAAQAHELKEVLDQALEAAIAVSRMDAGEILLWDPHRQVLDITAWKGVTADYVEGMHNLKAGESVSGQVFATGQPYVVEDVTTDTVISREVSRRQEVYRSGATFPLRVKDRKLGTLGVGVRRPRALTPDEIRLLQTIADQVAVAIDSATLFEDQSKYARRLIQLNQATLPVLSTLALDDLYKKIVESAANLIKADLVALPMIQPDGKSFAYAEATGIGAQRLKGASMLLTEGGLCGWVAAHAEPLLVPDVSKDPRVLKDLAQALGLKSALVVPIVRGDRTLGGISAFRTRTAFNEFDLRILQILANYASVSIENAKLFTQFRRHTEEQAALFQLSSIFLQTMDPQAVAEHAIHLVRQLLGVDACAVFTRESGSDTLKARAITGYPEGVGTPYLPRLGSLSQAGYAIERGIPVASLDLNRETRFQIPDTIREMECTTALAVPMRAASGAMGSESGPVTDAVVGALIVHTRATRSYTDSDIRLVSLIANQVASAVQAARLERGQEEAESRFRTLVESVPGVVWEVNLAARRITYLSPQVAALTGFPAEHYLSAADLRGDVHPEDLSRAEAGLAKITESEVVQGAEFRIAHRDGHYVWVRAYGRRVGGEAGGPPTLRGVVFDISSERQHEEEAKRLERLRALGEIASGVAHDFNNALFAIVGYTELITERVSDADLMRDLSSLKRAATDASRIVRRMEAFYKTQAASLVPLDINEIITETLDITRPRWKIYPQVQGIHIQVVTTLADLPIVNGDAAELREVFTNLIFNAVDAMPKGGTLTVESRPLDGKVAIVFKDTGMGMDEATRKRVFEAFYTTKGARGSGLGLSLCNSIVGRHGGTIEVESAPGAGSSFTVILPVGKEAPTEPAATEVPVAGRPLRLLAVDDEPQAREVLLSMLTRLGHSATLCENGESALAAFLRESYDAVITDLGMPAPNGFEVARRIHHASPDTPVVLITGWGELLAPEQLSQNCVSYLMKKPVMLARLRAILSEIGQGIDNGKPA